MTPLPASISASFLSSQRWFRAKARTIEKTGIEDVIPLPGTRFSILVIRVDYAEGDHDKYVLTIEGDAAEGRIPEALSSREFRDLLLDAVACNTKIPGRAGDLIASRTSVFPNACGSSELKMESFVSRAEQSNTSIVYGDRFILKLFRKIEAGVNPDLEIGTFLTEHGFKHTPAVLGKLEYRPAHNPDVYITGILQQFVPNQGDAWKYTLDCLSGFFERALPMPAIVSSHPMELIGHELPANVRELLGAYSDSARLLGLRTAQMHAALIGPGDSDFAPEPFTGQDGQKLYDEMLGQAGITFELLRRKHARLPERASEMARELLLTEHRVIDRFSPIRDSTIQAARIRYHGDFHLGQVLYTGSDFMIIDFEGEPARPLSERRGKTLAMRDVAGMIRSFQYAAYSARPERTDQPESSLDFWTTWISAIYLEAYFTAASDLPFVPPNGGEKRMVLDAFLLQKALYEVAYELNNRPDWVHIPLRGILGLMADAPRT